MTAEHAAAAGGEVEALRNERNHWIGEAHRYERLYHSRDKDATTWFKRMKAAEEELATRATAADTVLSAARRLCCGDNPAPHHAATDAHSQRMAFAEELARAVRGS
jgi:hypothetical protein